MPNQRVVPAMQDVGGLEEEAADQLKRVLDGLLHAGTVSEERHAQALAALEAQGDQQAVRFEFDDQSSTARKLRGMWFRYWPRRVEQDAVREMQQRTGCHDPFLCRAFLHGHALSPRQQWKRFLALGGRAARELDVDTASVMLTQFLAWRNANLSPLLVDPRPIMDELLAGWMSVLPGTSHRGDVVIHVCMRLMGESRAYLQNDVHTCWKALAYQLERAFARNANPMAQAVVLFDRTGYQRRNLRDIVLIRHCINMFVKYYPMRWRGGFVYPLSGARASGLRAFAAGALGKLLPPRLVFANSLATILCEIPQDVVPTRMGGCGMYEPDVIDKLVPESRVDRSGSQLAASSGMPSMSGRWFARSFHLEKEMGSDEAERREVEDVFHSHLKAPSFDLWRSQHAPVPAPALLFLTIFAVCDTTLEAFATQGLAASDGRSHVQLAVWSALGTLVVLFMCCSAAHQHRCTLIAVAMTLLCSCPRFYLDAHAAKQSASGVTTAATDFGAGGDSSLHSARSTFAATVVSHLLVFNTPPHKFFAACIVLWVAWFGVHCAVAGVLESPQPQQMHGAALVLLAVVLSYTRERSRVGRWRHACAQRDDNAVLQRELAHVSALAASPALSIMLPALTEN